MVKETVVHVVDLVGDHYVCLQCNKRSGELANIAPVKGYTLKAVMGSILDDGNPYNYVICGSQRGLGPTVQGPVVCSRCNESNSFAIPNQPDGSFKCYGCRQPGVY